MGTETTEIVTTVTCNIKTFLPTTMTPENYDKLTPEERELKDKEDRAREEKEQAGIHDLFYCSDARSTTI